MVQGTVFSSGPGYSVFKWSREQWSQMVQGAVFRYLGISTLSDTGLSLKWTFLGPMPERRALLELGVPWGRGEVRANLGTKRPEWREMRAKLNTSKK